LTEAGHVRIEEPEIDRHVMIHPCIQDDDRYRPQSLHLTHAVMQSSAVSVYAKPVLGAGLSEELTMTKSILAITILALTTSGALAAHHRTHHHHAMNASPAVGAPPPMMGAPSPVMWPGGVNSKDHADYVKNLRESGYNPKNDFNTTGTIRTQ
jgi:hypothetical protein